MLLPLLLPATLAIALMAGSAGAEERVAGFITDEALLTMCDSVDGEDRCTGYIAGVADALALAQRYGKSIAGWRACIPPSVAGRQMRDIVTQALSEHPEQRRIAAVGVVAGALTVAFTCPPLVWGGARPATY